MTTYQTFLNNYYYKNYDNNFNNNNFKLDFEKVINYDIIYETIYDLIKNDIKSDILFKINQYAHLDFNYDNLKIKIDNLLLPNKNKEIDINLIIDLFLDPDIYNK